jgi:pseudouridine synthase
VPKWLEAARTGNKAGGDWLARALGRVGALAPDEIDGALAAGRVRLDGKIARQPFMPVSEQSRVSVDGIEVDIRHRTRVLMLHKPAGVVTAARDPEGHGTVFDFIPAELQKVRWMAVGRLDRDTTGLLLFTNDERFVARATDPKTHVPKRYVAQVHSKATEAMLEPLRKGMTLDDGPARPALARVRDSGVVELTLTEGRHHQVKRMLAAVGLPVLKLHREAIGALLLDVDEGTTRELRDDEIRLV